jgi:hypothetical protein
MNDDSRIAKPTRRSAVRLKRRNVIGLAALRGARFGAQVAAIPLAVGVVPFVTEISEGRSARAFELAGALAAVVLFCATLAALLFGISAALSLPPRVAGDDGPDSLSPRLDPARPFSERLARYLGESAVSAADDRAPGSRMAFFSALVSGRRYGPKSAAYVREILARIHRLLSGSC